MFGYENNQVYPVCLSENKSKNHMELFLLQSEDKSQGGKSPGKSKILTSLYATTLNMNNITTFSDWKLRTK